MAKKNRGGLTESKLKRFYRLMSATMVDFDCGQMCAPRNNGIPHCCDNEKCVPILFKPEFRWLGKKAKFWREKPIRTRADQEMVDEAMDYNVFSYCPGVANCSRSLRALICRAFPFEPHLDAEGKVIGLAFQDERDRSCPLVGMPRKTFNDKYIKNAMQFWQELIDIYPSERNLYMEESGKREQRARKRGQNFQLFT